MLLQREHWTPYTNNGRVLFIKLSAYEQQEQQQQRKIGEFKKISFSNTLWKMIEKGTKIESHRARWMVNRTGHHIFYIKALHSNSSDSTIVRLTFSLCFQICTVDCEFNRKWNWNLKKGWKINIFNIWIGLFLFYCVAFTKSYTNTFLFLMNEKRGEEKNPLAVVIEINRNVGSHGNSESSSKLRFS